MQVAEQADDGDLEMHVMRSALSPVWDGLHDLTD